MIKKEKSKLPELTEIVCIGMKLLSDLKISITEALQDYKRRHKDDFQSSQKPSSHKRKTHGTGSSKHTSSSHATSKEAHKHGTSRSKH